MFSNHAILPMKSIISEPKSAESRESSVCAASQDISLANYESMITSSFLMQDSFSGNLESENVTFTKHGKNVEQPIDYINVSVEENVNSNSYKLWKQSFDIEFEEALKVGNKNYSPQVFKEVSGSVADLLEKMERVKSIPIPKEFYYQVEGGCILATSLLTATNVASAVCAIMSYARAATNESVASQVKKILVENSWSCQALSLIHI